MRAGGSPSARRTRGRRGIRSCAGGSRMDYVPFGTPAEQSFDDTFFGKRPARQEGRGFASPLLPFSDALLTFSENMV